MRVHLALLGMMVLAGAVPAACGGEPSTSFGPADGIVGRAAPTPTVTSSATSTSTSTSMPTGTGTQPPPASDGGTPSGDDSGTTGTEAGGTGACAVSWATDVFPMLESTGSGACGSAACHASGAQLPAVLDGNPTGTYNSFVNFTLLNNTGYITPGANAASSPIDCNLVTATCGPAMPVAGTGTLSATQKQTIDTWVKCGVPMN